MTEVEKKLLLSREEAEGLSLRDIKCPDCNFTITKVYSDIRGHYLSKCPKCKSQHVINLAYFRTQRGVGKLKDKYYEKSNSKKLKNQ